MTNATTTPHTAPRRPSPAVAFIGRKNSGKTTLVEQVIAELCARGLSVGAIKHHGHPEFAIDAPGTDSWRHRQAGATDTVVLSKSAFALMKTLDEEMTYGEALRFMPGHDLVVVEGFRQAGLPSLELFRAANERDVQALPAFLARLGRRDEAGPSLPDAPGLPAGVVTDIGMLAVACAEANIPVFSYDDVPGICDFVQERYARAPLTIAIQAGGESRRMGHSKARTKFLGRPLIEHMLDLVEPFASELIITTNEADKLAYLQDECPDLRLVADVRDERGALPGLLTALSNARNDYVAVVACDMVAFSPRLLGIEAVQLQGLGADCIVPYTEGYWEPFAAVYRASACLPALTRCVDAGMKRMQDFISQVDCAPFDGSAWQRRGRVDPFANVNTPEELSQAEVLFRLYG